MTSLTGGLEITLGQTTYRHYMRHLREKKRELTGIKDEVDSITGRWASILARFGKSSIANLRPLIERKIAVLGDIDNTMQAMTHLYQGEPQRLLTYAHELKEQRLALQESKPAELTQVTKPTDALSLLDMIIQSDQNDGHLLARDRHLLGEHLSLFYAQQLVVIKQECNQAYRTFVLVGDKMHQAYKFLKAASPSIVSRIELDEARRFLTKTMEEARSVVARVYSSVDQGYSELTDFTNNHRLPVLDAETKEIILLNLS